MAEVVRVVKCIVAMSTINVSSYTVMCRRSPAMPASSAGTPTSHSWRPAPPPTTFHTTPVAIKCRRPMSVTCALPEKQRPPAFSIPPTVLLYPVPPDVKERWDIKDEKDQVKLWFQVPGLSEGDLKVSTSEDMLEIERIGAKTGGGTGDGGEAPVDVHGVGFFHVRLLMTKEHDSANVKAELKAGMLEITVGKTKGRKPNTVFGPKDTAQSDNSTGSGTNGVGTQSTSKTEQNMGKNGAQGEAPKRTPS